jgi:hypothetical protein
MVMSESAMRVRCLASTRVRGEGGEGDEHGRRDEHGVDERGTTGEGMSTEVPDGMSTEVPGGGDDDSESSDSESSDSESSSDMSTTSTTTSTTSSHYTSCIHDAQLSPDGTCIFTSDYNRSFSVYPLSPDLLAAPSPQPLQPYAHFTSPNPIWAFACNPHFNLHDASSTHVLVSRRDSYITLHNALWDMSATATDAQTTPGPVDIHTPLVSYKLINHLTEAVTAPASLTYAHDNTHFFAGAQNAIATFDLGHTTDPIHRIPTIPSARSKLKGGGRGFKGTISALALSPPSASASQGLLAAGARTRYVGLYDALRSTELTHFALPGAHDSTAPDAAHVDGAGVSMLKWSPCGTYLYVAERASDALLIYDVRNFSLTLGWCAGRHALTKQRLGFDVWGAGAGTDPYAAAGAHEVWAGGTDGCVRVWRDPYLREGAVDADEVVRVGHGDMPVVSALVHPSGNVAVAACGTVGVAGELRKGVRRGGGVRPIYRECGFLDILGLGV